MISVFCIIADSGPWLLTASLETMLGVTVTPGVCGKAILVFPSLTQISLAKSHLKQYYYGHLADDFLTLALFTFCVG